MAPPSGDVTQGGPIPEYVSRDGKPIPQSFLDWEKKHNQFLIDNPPPPANVDVHIAVHHGKNPRHGG
jgi:hypothetical protein